MMSDKVSKSIEEALAQLHDERERIEGAIAKLEGFLGNLNGSKASRAKSKNRIDQALRKAGRRRVVAKVRSRAGWTEEARKAAAERMRKYWEEQHKATADGGATTRRGRRSTKSAPRTQVKERSRKGWTEDARAAAAERMRKYWEDRKGDKQSSSAK